jgi:hypothetical protein
MLLYFVGQYHLDHLIHELFIAFCKCTLPMGCCLIMNFAYEFVEKALILLC